MECEDAMRLLIERIAAARAGNLERVEQIDEERFAHDPDESTVCDCWTKAIRIMDAVTSTGQVNERTAA